MNQRAGTRERIIAANKYNPPKGRRAHRPVRVISNKGATQTYKKKGDLIIDSLGRSHEVKQNGWY